VREGLLMCKWSGVVWKAASIEAGWEWVIELVENVIELILGLFFSDFGGIGWLTNSGGS